jgi:hypothetical protein
MFTLLLTPLEKDVWDWVAEPCRELFAHEEERAEKQMNCYEEAVAFAVYLHPRRQWSHSVAGIVDDLDVFNDMLSRLRMMRTQADWSEDKAAVTRVIRKLEKLRDELRGPREGDHES